MRLMKSDSTPVTDTVVGEYHSACAFFTQNSRKLNGGFCRAGRSEGDGHCCSESPLGPGLGGFLVRHAVEALALARRGPSRRSRRPIPRRTRAAGSGESFAWREKMYIHGFFECLFRFIYSHEDDYFTGYKATLVCNH